MIKYEKCPACHKRGIRVEVPNDDFEILTSGRPLSEMPCQVRCEVCLRRIKFAVEKKKDK